MHFGTINTAFPLCYYNYISNASILSALFIFYSLHICHGSLSKQQLAPIRASWRSTKVSQHPRAFRAKCEAEATVRPRPRCLRRTHGGRLLQAQPSGPTLPHRGRPRLPGPLPPQGARLLASGFLCAGAGPAYPLGPALPPRRLRTRPGAHHLRTLSRGCACGSMEGESTSAVLSGFVLGALAFQHLNTDSDTVRRGVRRAPASPEKRLRTGAPRCPGPRPRAPRRRPAGSLPWRPAFPRSWAVLGVPPGRQVFSRTSPPSSNQCLFLRPDRSVPHGPVSLFQRPSFFLVKLGCERMESSQSVLPLR